LVLTPLWIRRGGHSDDRGGCSSRGGGGFWIASEYLAMTGYQPRETYPHSVKWLNLLGRALYANVRPMEKVEKQVQEGGLQVYELGYHIVSTVAEENLPKEVETLKAIILKDGGSLVSEGEPKLINLAYPMTKSVADSKKKFTTAYFGWLKFETKSELMTAIKKAVDANPNVLRYLLIKTVRENTMFTPKLTVRTPGKEEAPKAKKSIKTTETKAASVEELDKTIDELVLE
jgi:ribosomal protein S6